MNRRRFFRAAASFVAGCALGLGMRPKMDAVESVVVTQDYEMMVFFDMDALKLVEDKNGIMFISTDGVRKLEYAEIQCQWTKLNEPPRKA